MLDSNARRFTEEQKAEIIAWVRNLSAWSHFFTGTFAGEFTEDAAVRAWRRFSENELAEWDSFMVCERNPSRAGHHVHCLVTAPLRVSKEASRIEVRAVWRAWFDRHGRNRLETIRDGDAVSRYCSKHAIWYLLKGLGHYEISLCDPFSKDAGSVNGHDRSIFSESDDLAR